VTGDLDQALVTATHALEMSDRVGDFRLRVLATSNLELLLYHRGDFERVVALARANLTALPLKRANKLSGLAAPLAVNDRTTLVESLAQLGRFTEAIEAEAEMRRLAERTRHAFTFGLVYRASGALWLLKGDFAKACSMFDQVILAARSGNNPMLLPTTVTSSAWALAQLGNNREAANRLREGEELVERLVRKQIVHQLDWGFLSLGRAAFLLGRFDEARGLGDRSLKFSLSHPGNAAHALHLLGDITTHPDSFDAQSGDSHYRQALALAEPRGMRPLIAHCHLGLSKLYQRTGRREQAREHLTIATTMYREMDMSFWLEQAEAETRELT
jgi:tetratricopeptide (TPR) repeat protein